VCRLRLHTNHLQKVLFGLENNKLLSSTSPSTHIFTTSAVPPGNVVVLPIRLLSSITPSHTAIRKLQQPTRGLPDSEYPRFGVASELDLQTFTSEHCPNKCRKLCIDAAVLKSFSYSLLSKGNMASTSIFESKASSTIS
jgi:hypothetical protein